MKERVRLEVDSYVTHVHAPATILQIVDWTFEFNDTPHGRLASAVFVSCRYAFGPSLDVDLVVQRFNRGPMCNAVRYEELRPANEMLLLAYVAEQPRLRCGLEIGHAHPEQTSCVPRGRI